MAATPQYQPASNYSSPPSYAPSNYATQHPQYASPHYPSPQPTTTPSPAPAPLQYGAAPPSSPVPSSSDYATVYSNSPAPPAPSYASSAPQEIPPANYSYEPSYDSTGYSFTAPPDPSYSPRAPSLPVYADYAPAAPSTGYSTWAQPAPAYSSDYQLSRSSSYTSGYVPADPYNQALYNQASYNQASAKWSYDQTVEVQDGKLQGQASYQQVENRPFEKSFIGEGGGIYAYDGGSSQPYGSRGTGSTRWSNSDASSYSSLNDLPKIAKALPKIESESKGGGVQKYHVKVLNDSAGLSGSVICQIGLDGVRMLDPSTSRTLRIYPLETITKWEVNEPSVFTFWAKSSVDFEQRRTRLQSSAATTNAILDALTAACVQLCEMVGGEDSSKTTVSSTTTDNQKKAGSFDWLMRRPAVQEEKQHWVPDEAVTKCTGCASDFGPFLRRHHCRNCGDIFCDKCTRGRISLTADEESPPVRVCDRCLAEVTQRLSNAKDSSKFASQHTHEDLAKKLQEEMKRNASAARRTLSDSDALSRGSDKQASVLNCSKCRAISIVPANVTSCPTCGNDSGRNGSAHKSSSRLSSTSEGSRRRTREVACPTCTVHLEVEVPSSGSETVECGVCQHPFLVSA